MNKMSKEMKSHDRNHELALDLAALGYPGFSYLKTSRKRFRDRRALSEGSFEPPEVRSQIIALTSSLTERTASEISDQGFAIVDDVSCINNEADERADIRVHSITSNINQQLVTKLSNRHAWACHLHFDSCLAR
jgi:hypothetical protein